VPGPGGPAWSRWVGRFLGRVVWNARVVGAEHVPAEGPVIVAANHTGLLDGPLLLGVAPRGLHILVKESMFVGPVGWVLHASGQIPVDDHGGRAALSAGLGVLRRGDAVGVFPEGTRGRGDLADARAGLAWLALNGAAPVVPAAILGTRRTGRGVNSLPAPRRRLHVEFGEPVVVGREPGVPGKVALAVAADRLHEDLRTHVAAVVERTGIPLPADDPLRERPPDSR
jgi:1-acyl-sn-glycerol-3-phosphate acyltransferase